MIVSKVKAQIAFGVIAVAFTVLMVVVQFKNLSDEVLPPEPEPVVNTTPPPEPKPLPKPEPPPEPAEEPVPVPAPVPEPEPEPEPFVMKPVGGTDAIEGEYLVSLFDDNDRKKFIAAVENAGGRVLLVSEYGNVVKVRLRDSKQLEEVLRAGPVPLDYSANFRVYNPEGSEREPPKPDRFYGLFGKNALLWLGLKQDHADWGRGSKVAVMDSGVMPHPVFKKDQVREISIVEGESAGDPAGVHGTAVASLIAGWHPEMMGVAPGSEILSVRVTDGEGSGDVLDLARGIMKALEEGANVINISLGTYGNSFVLKNAVDEAVKRGVAVVASVGNDALDTVQYPAAYEGVVGVSSVDSLGQKLYFGNTGEAVDLCAPGYGVKSAWEDGKFNEDFSGTSASAPFVSGMLAVLMGRGLSAEEAVKRVISLADDSGEPGRDDAFGEGILDIRRIEEHGERGIYDAAVSCLLMKKGGRVVVGLQNRGTEVLSGARIEIQSGSRYINFDIGMTRPGQTIALDFHVKESDYDVKGVLTVTAEIPLAGLQDNYPGNNKRRLVVVDKNLAER